MDLEAYFKNYKPNPIDVREKYAVFVPLIQVEGEPSLLFQMRCKTMRRQPSEICFPGGRMEKGESVTEAAVRELREELGIKPQKIYGESDFLVLRTGSVVYPVVGSLEENPSFLLCEEEVDHVFTVPISVLKEQKEELEVILSPEPQFPKETLALSQEYLFRKGVEKFPVYRVDDYVIWGITARIIKNIISLL